MRFKIGLRRNDSVGMVETAAGFGSRFEDLRRALGSKGFLPVQLMVRSLGFNNLRFWLLKIDLVF